MVRQGFLVRFEAKIGKESIVEELLHSALPLVEAETGTTAWFAVRFARGSYGIFGAFPDAEERDIHLSGPVARALVEREELFMWPPTFHKLTIIAERLPASHIGVTDTKGLLLTFKARSGRRGEVEQFLHNAQNLVKDEPGTTAWFAIHTDKDEYGIFDVFPDSSARFDHLLGQVPRQLARNGLSFLASMPSMEMVKVEAEKLAA
jgi:quinol monooxygenase YgiN